jgi:hypothetical protein
MWENPFFSKWKIFLSKLILSQANRKFNVYRDLRNEYLELGLGYFKRSKIPLIL